MAYSIIRSTSHKSILDTALFNFYFIYLIPDFIEIEESYIEKSYVSFNLTPFSLKSGEYFCNYTNGAKMQKVFNDKLANKLKSESLSSKDWWPILKTIITPNSKAVKLTITYIPMKAIWPIFLIISSKAKHSSMMARVFYLTCLLQQLFLLIKYVLVPADKAANNVVVV